MGQIEVLDFLRAKAEFYPNKMFTVKEISKGLKEAGCSSNEVALRRSLSKLASFGFIKCETIGWNRTFRYVQK